jgi:PAS domain S-box-containing protein
MARTDLVTDREQRASRVAAQAAITCALFAGTALLSGICEWRTFDDRLLELLVFELFLVSSAAITLYRIRRRPENAVAVMLVFVNAAALAIIAYHGATGASAEGCLLVLTATFCSTTVFCPWGARTQLLATVSAAIAFPIVLFAGSVDFALAWYTLLLFLACVIGLTAYGSHIIESGMHRAALLTEEVRAREMRLRSYLDQALVGIGVLSPAGRWQDVNDELCRILGYGREELTALSWSQIAVDGGPNAQLEGLLSGREEATYGDGRLRGRGKRELDAIIAARGVRGSGGAVDDVVVMVQDITERKNAERALAEAKDLAEEAYRVKGDFLATMSHELRTPMNVIFGMTEMALDPDSGVDQRECLETTRRAAKGLIVLMNEVLDLSRMEAGRLELRPRSFVVREWLAESIEPLSALARSKGLRLEWEVAPEVGAIATGDPNRLRQVLVNLVGNALKYTDAGGVRVLVATDTGDTARASLHFTVADTGVGIPPSEQERIFEAYSQGGPGVWAPREGTGLGLAICSRLVDLMGGRIWVESDVGEGSRFHFTAALAPTTDAT